MFAFMLAFTIECIMALKADCLGWVAFLYIALRLLDCCAAIYLSLVSQDT